jgi:hypothetical protein
MRGYEVTDMRPDRKGDAMPQEGTPFRRIRMDNDLWQQFEEAVTAASPALNRSLVIRMFVLWYTGRTNDLPQRPEPRRDDGK